MSYEVWSSLDQKETPHNSSDYKLNITHLLASINEQFSLAWSPWGRVYEHTPKFLVVRMFCPNTLDL